MTMKKVYCRLIYYVAMAVAVAAMCSAGYGVTSWRYWAVTACMIVAHISGAESEV